MKSAITFALTVAGMLLRGLVFSLLWAWFVVPLGAPKIGIPAAIGISLTINYLTIDLSATRERIDGLERVIAGLMLSAMVLGIGWLIHQF